MIYNSWRNLCAYDDIILAYGCGLRAIEKDIYWSIGYSLKGMVITGVCVCVCVCVFSPSGVGSDVEPPLNVLVKADTETVRSCRGNLYQINLYYVPHKIVW